MGGQEKALRGEETFMEGRRQPFEELWAVGRVHHSGRKPSDAGENGLCGGLKFGSDVGAQWRRVKVSTNEAEELGQITCILVGCAKEFRFLL